MNVADGQRVAPTDAEGRLQTTMVYTDAYVISVCDKHQAGVLEMRMKLSFADRTKLANWVSLACSFPSNL